MGIDTRIQIQAFALESLHHGSSSVGNTRLFRTQEVVLEDGSISRVPYISGNSIKHMIREHASLYAIEAMGIKDGSLSRSVVDLLISGGRLSKSGSGIDLGQARELAVMFPALSLCGYSASNWICDSKIKVDNLHLVCSENSIRVPETLSGSLHLQNRAGYYYEEEYGTRHEPTRSPSIQSLLVDEDLPGSSNQMIYDFEVIKSGSHWWSSFFLHNVSEREIQALLSGLSHACEEIHPRGFVYRLGGKTAVGMGRLAFTYEGNLGEVPFSDALTENEGVREYTKHLSENKDDILTLLEGIAK